MRDFLPFFVDSRTLANSGCANPRKKTNWHVKVCEFYYCGLDMRAPENFHIEATIEKSKDGPTATERGRYNAHALHTPPSARARLFAFVRFSYIGLSGRIGPNEKLIRSVGPTHNREQSTVTRSDILYTPTYNAAAESTK